MTTATGLRCRRPGQGFTLIELLLAMGLLLLLLGAAVFSLNSLQRGRDLPEAALQLEGLLHFARAQAAQTGRRVQLNFEEEIDEDFFLALGNMRLLWEPKPLEEPGMFQEIPETAEDVKRITDAVMIESVELLDVNGQELPTLVGEADDGLAAGDDAFQESTPPINFYPDGSSDSARIIITSWDYDDPRRMELRILGLTGSIRRRALSSSDDALGAEPETSASADSASSKNTFTNAAAASD